MFGWQGKILEIDLTLKQTKIIKPSGQIYQKYIGGRGLAGYYLKPYIEEKWSAPEMPLLFFTGPLVQTPSPTSGRMTIMSKSPLTGAIGDTSVGGSLGWQIKKAGFDGLIIKGQSRSLSGLIIKNNRVEIIEASFLKEKSISSVLKKIPSSGSSAIIGPAAENGVRFANIVVDGHFFSGRGGLGLVMAKKNLKFLQIAGSNQTKIYDLSKVKQAKEQIFRLVAASPFLKGEFGLSSFGTGVLFDLIQNKKMMPTDNFKKMSFRGAEKLNAWHYQKKYRFKNFGCLGCHLRCKKKTEAGESLPEYETMAHFSALLNNHKIETVFKANRLCNDLGLDTISAASTLACYQEINQKKLSSVKIITLLKEIAYNLKEGQDLKKGSVHYAFLKGKKEASVSIKKLELPAYDPRGSYGLALAFATSTRGACHLRAYPLLSEVLNKPVAINRFSFIGKAKNIKINEDLNAIVDSLTVCKFIFFAASLEEYATLFEGVTGLTTTAQDLLKKGERIYYNERIMNWQNGFSIKDDDLPKLFFKANNKQSLNRNDFLKARADYYKIRGLNKKGEPLKEKIEELGLSDSSNIF